jgi:Exostosin family
VSATLTSTPTLELNDRCVASARVSLRVLATQASTLHARREPMKVLLATVADHAWSRILRAEIDSLVRLDRFGQHVVVDAPAEAEIILFLDAHQHPNDWRMHALRTHSYVREFPGRVFVYDERDAPRDLLPGAYVSMPRTRFNVRRHRAAGYYKLRNDTRGMRDTDPDLLFSFQGRRSGAVRNEVLSLQCSRALVEDTSHYDAFADSLSEASEMRARYCEVIGRSKFVLCPRGAGTSSFRLFEALAAGRVPVVLSDDWVEPRGIDWTSCSVRIAERDAAEVPQRLESIEQSWPVLSAAARTAYDEMFGPTVWFHRVVEHCADLQRGGVQGVTRQSLTLAYWRAAARHWRHAATARWTRGNESA